MGSSSGRLQVPLDHSGRIAGVQRLAFARIPARRRVAGAIAVIPGGPGQPALPFARDIGADLRPLLLADHGVRVTGAVTGRGRGRARLTVSGPSAAPGTISVTPSRTTGTLGGS
jgi:hypothetical protein